MKSEVDSWCWVLIVLVMVVASYCHAAFTMKRAVPVYKLSSKHVQGNNSFEKDKDEFFSKFWKEHNGGSCPFGQVLQRNHTVCCVVSACGPGDEIEECYRNETEDMCSKCKPGFIQMNNISSLGMKETTCFLQVRDHEDCPMGDMKPARKNLSDNFPLPCECKFKDCYIEDEVGSCKKNMECKPGFQMNRKSGSCDPCPWYAYKNISGCQPCTINVTLLRQGKPQGLFIHPSMRTTTAAKDSTEYSPENASLAMRENTQIKTQKSPSSNIIYVVLLAIIGVALIVLTIMRVHSYYRKSVSRTSDYTHTTPSIEPLLEGGEYGNDIWNCRMNGGQTTGLENGGAIHANRRMLDDKNRRIMPHDDGATNHGSIPVEIDNPVNTPARAKTRIDQFQRAENLDLSKRDNKVRTFEARSSGHGAIAGIEENVTCSAGRLTAESRGHHVVQGETNDETNAVSGTNVVDLLECGANEDHENAKHTSEVETKKLGEKKNNSKISNVSIHGNQFQDCMIFIGEKARPKDCKGNSNKTEVHFDNLKNISGSFEMSQNDIRSMTNSGYPSGIDYSPILKQPDRRPVNADQENDVAFRVTVNNGPPCRPELTDGDAGTDTAAAPRREVKFNSKDLKMNCSASVMEQDLIGDGRKVTGGTRRAENPDIRGSPDTRGADPLQRSISRKRPIGRVQPLRQNSESAEVRRVSVYPSERHNDESFESIVSFNSMSYAVIHCDSGLSNGYMTVDIANNDDIDDDENGNMRLDIEDIPQRNSPIGREHIRGGSGEMCSDLDGTGDVCDGASTNLKTTVNLDRQRHQSALLPFRRDVNRTGVTHSVPPITIREGPEGNSISYSGNENSHFISRPDIQQTHRKVVAVEDSTREKEVNSESTKAKIVDDDDDFTRYKKAKELEECENDTCLKNVNKDNNELENTEASFEINSEEMQNVNNAQEIVDKGKDLAGDENAEGEDVHTENSLDIYYNGIPKVNRGTETVDESKNLVEDEKAKHKEKLETEHGEECEDIDSEKSFEVDSNEIENIREHKTNSDGIEPVVETNSDVDAKGIEELKHESSC